MSFGLVVLEGSYGGELNIEKRIEERARKTKENEREREKLLTYVTSYLGKLPCEGSFAFLYVCVRVRKW